MAIHVLGTTPPDVCDVGETHSVVTTAGYIPTNVSRGIDIGTSGVTNQFNINFDAGAEKWGSFYHKSNNTGVNGYVMQLNGQGQSLFRVRADGYIEFWNGSAWGAFQGSVAGSVVGMALFNLQRIDWYLKLHDTTGVFEIKVNGTVAYSYTGDTIRNTAVAIDSIIHNNLCSGGGNLSVYSHMVIGDDSSVHGVIFNGPLVLTAAGDSSQWSGGYTGLDDVSGSFDLDIITSATLGNKSFFGFTDLAAGIGGGGMRLALVGRIAKGVGSTLGSVELGARSGSSEAFGTAHVATTALKPKVTIIDNDPATGVAWLPAGINSAQVGPRAAT